MPQSAIQKREISQGENPRIVSVDVSGKLDSGESLTGTPNVTEVTTTDLVLSDKQVNTTALTINDTSVAIGRAIMFRVNPTGATVGQKYEIDFDCLTDAGQKVDGRLTLEVI